MWDKFGEIMVELCKFFRNIGLQVMQGLHNILLSFSTKLSTKDQLARTSTNGREDESSLVACLSS